MTEVLRFAAHGHPEIRATHHKTLEFTAAAEITARASCIVGVGAALPTEPVAGPIRITLTSNGYSVSCRAIGNSAWQPGESAVIRRSPQRLPDTFATDADLTAADLPRELVAALGSHDCEVAVIVERDNAPAQGTLVHLRLTDGAGHRLGAELAAADLVIGEDAPARAALAGLNARWDRPAAAPEVLAQGGRVLVLSSASAPATDSAIARAGAAAGAHIEVLGFPPELSVILAAGDNAPVILVTAAALRTIRQLASAAPDAALVVRSPANSLAELVEAIGRPDAQLTAVPLDDHERPVRGTLASLTLPVRGDLLCRIAGTGTPTQAPIHAEALVRDLLAQSVTPRSIAIALSAQPGWSRRQAYDFVLAIAGSG